MQPAPLRVLFGVSSAFYGGTSYGNKVDGAPMLVRSFTVVDETVRSSVLQGGRKIPRKTMVWDTGSFKIAMFERLEDAKASLASKAT